MKITVDIDIDKIYRERADEAGTVMAVTAERLMQPYVPKSDGAAAHLVNAVQVIKTGEGKSEIIYPGPYAHYVYIGEVYGPNFMTENGWRSYAGKSKTPTGRQMEYTGAPERGKEWDKKMIQQRGKELVEAVAKHMGGKAK